MGNNINTINIGGITTLWIINDIFIENLYENIGRYDYVACYTLKPDSESYNNYGADVTGTLVYTRNERENLEQSYKSGNKNIGKIRINESNLELSEDKRRCLKEDGIEITDIQYICVIPMPSENLYINDSIRKPKRIEITLPDDFSYQDSLLTLHHLYEKCIIQSRELCPHEWNEFLAVKLLYSPKELSDDERQKAYDSSGRINEEVFHTLLGIKKNLGILTDKELQTLQILNQREYDRKLYVFDKALKGSGASIKQLTECQIELAAILLSTVIKFKPIRLNTLAHRYTIYLDSEGYLHILLRHVKETSLDLGPINKKTKFMWKFEDVIYALKGVVGVIADDYDIKRESNKGQIYWSGKKSIEFLGDYYDLRLDANGSVKTWFRRHNSILGK